MQTLKPEIRMRKKAEVLTEIDQSGLLKELLNLGVVSSSILLTIDVFRKYKAFIAQGKSIGDAQFLTAMEFRISERHVRRIVTEMKK